MGRHEGDLIDLAPAGRDLSMTTPYIDTTLNGQRRK
ncbi:hypothetical protein DEA8626_02318 [Defluviimonas aquaemixtae]|uniref:Uncharacterized protein n=1 Tax=Albidovulum aquaemixtae TaxID=1542388 RepID=A0A2R8B824_9RHOB|nr:hypothetical protein DEA8626_02318 [Defluviimonas aquaemixtae]